MEKRQKTTVAGLIFSKDRAMQLQAAIESFLLYCRDADSLSLFVLYKVSGPLHRRQYDRLRQKYDKIIFMEETDFRSQVLQVVQQADHILFLVDDNLFVRPFCLQEILQALAGCPNAIGFSLRLGTNIRHNYMQNQPTVPPAFMRAKDRILSFDWTNGQHDFGYPLELSSSVYRCSDLLGLLQQLPFENPNLLEGRLAANTPLFRRARPILLCFDQSVAFCNPINMVQSVCGNRCGQDRQYDAEQLAVLFEKGQAIDIARYKDFTPQSCHQEVPLHLSSATPALARVCPLITIEMVTYNTEKHIGRAVESVLAQTYENFELLIVDDGSTDNTEHIVKAFSDPRIRYFRQNHQNAAAARNHAISQAKGDAILVVDSDDWLSRDYLADVVQFARLHSAADFLYPSRLTLVDGHGRATGTEWTYPDFTDSRILPGLLLQLGKSPIPNPGSLIRRRLYQRIGSYEHLDTVEDFVFLCRNALQIRFKRIDTHGPYYYRTSSAGLSHRFKARNEITARVLNDMVSAYPPEMLFPDLKQIPDSVRRIQAYYEFLTMTFYGLAQTNQGRYPEPFHRLGDRYRARLVESIPISPGPCRSIWALTGPERTQKMLRQGIDCLKTQKPDQSLVYLEEVRRQREDLPGLHYGRALAFLQLGRTDQALLACREEVDRNPNHTEARNLLNRFREEDLMPVW
ncbi:MAG: glycosyltransferase [Sedimentisphaerales bacterium]|nr:glycosyltransferase [Sedimentisphaerales bacterium]